MNNDYTPQKEKLRAIVRAHDERRKRDDYGLQPAEEKHTFGRTSPRAISLPPPPDPDSGPAPQETEEHVVPDVPEEEASIFLADGPLDPAYIEVRTKEFQKPGGVCGEHWVATGRYIVAYRRRRDEDGDAPYVEEEPRLYRHEPQTVKLGKIFVRAGSIGSESMVVWRSTDPQPSTSGRSTWLDRQRLFTGWQRREHE